MYAASNALNGASVALKKNGGTFAGQLSVRASAAAWHVAAKTRRVRQQFTMVGMLCWSVSVVVEDATVVAQLTKFGLHRPQNSRSVASAGGPEG